jgi:hypothetical protein
MDLEYPRRKRLLATGIAAALFIASALPLPTTPRIEAAPTGPTLGTSAPPLPTNATSAPSVRTPALAMPDLQVQAKTKTCGPSSRTVSVQINNVGSRAAGPYSVDVELVDAAGGSVIAGSQQHHFVNAVAVGRDVNLPPITATYSQAVVARIGATPLIVEDNAANNTASNTTASSGCPLPDLQVTTVPAPPDSRKGCHPKYVCVVNAGTASSPVTTVRVRKSQETPLGWFPTGLLDYDVPSLAVGTSWQTPDSFCSGADRAFSARVDEPNYVIEMDEENNRIVVQGP